MNEVRAGCDENSFVNSLVVYNFDAGIARTTYRYLQEKQGIRFPIQATDLLDEDLGLGGEDLGESIRDLLELTGRLDQPGLRHTPLVTVEDLVRYLQGCPRLTELVA